MVGKFQNYFECFPASGRGGLPWDDVPLQSRVTAEFGVSHALFIAARMARWPGVHSVFIGNDDDPEEAYVIHLPDDPQ